MSCALGSKRHTGLLVAASLWLCEEPSRTTQILEETVRSQPVSIEKVSIIIWKSSLPDFLEMIADTGCRLYACKASVDLLAPDKEDVIPQVAVIITVGEFYQTAAGRIIFT